MFNLSNAVYGWNPERKFNVSAFIGAAANIGFGNDRANELNNAGYKMSYVWDGTKVRPVGRVQPFADNDRNRVSICIINE